MSKAKRSRHNRVAPFPIWPGAITNFDEERQQINAYPPRPARAEVSIAAIVMSFGGPALQATIRNVSKAGLCIETIQQQLTIGGQVLIITDLLGSIPAQVRWSLGRRSGCYFNAVISDQAARYLAAAVASS